MKNLFIVTLLAAVAAAQPVAEPRPARQAEQAVQRAAAQVQTAQQAVQSALGGGLGNGLQAAGAFRLSNPTVEFISGVNVGPTVIGAPYSAETVTESIQTLPDGNRIVQRSTTKQYRDREGRERREAGGVVMISDPVAKASYTLRPDSKTADKLGASTSNRVIYRTESGGGSYNVTYLNGQPFTIALPAELAQAERALAAGPIEVLGTRNIEGVPATGTRTVTTIAAGTIGNERAIQVIDERWVSADLQLTVMTRHADPRSAETIYKLTNIQRKDQDKSLFEIPADYKTNTPPGIATPASPAPPRPAKAK